MTSYKEISTYKTLTLFLLSSPIWSHFSSSKINFNLRISLHDFILKKIMENDMKPPLFTVMEIFIYFNFNEYLTRQEKMSKNRSKKQKTINKTLILLLLLPSRENCYFFLFIYQSVTFKAVAREFVVWTWHLPSSNYIAVHSAFIMFSTFIIWDWDPLMVLAAKADITCIFTAKAEINKMRENIIFR